MIDQLELALLVELCKERQLGVGRAALYQTATRVVTDTTDHRGTNAGRADNRVRVFTKGREHFL